MKKIKISDEAEFWLTVLAAVGPLITFFLAASFLESELLIILVTFFGIIIFNIIFYFKE